MIGGIDMVEEKKDVVYLCDVRELTNKNKNIFKKLGINTMSELLNFVQRTDLMKMDGIGKASVENITEVCSEYINGYLDKYVFTRNHKPFSELEELYDNLPITCLDILGMSQKFMGRIVNKYGTLGELREAEYYVLADDCKEIDKDTIYDIANILTNEPASVLKYLLNLIRKWKNYPIFLKRAKGYTLAESGREVENISRQGAQLFIDGVCAQLKPFVTLFFDSVVDVEQYLDLQVIFDEFNDSDDAYVIMYVGKNLSNYEYVEPAEKYVKIGNEKKGTFTKNLLKNLANIFADGAYLSEKEEELDEALQQSNASFLDREDILNILKSEKYSIYGDYVLKGKVSYGKLAAKVINDYFPEGVSVCSDDKVPPKEDFLEMRRLVERKYHTKKDIPNRAFSSRMVDFTIQCDKGKVIAKERVKTDFLLMTKIRDYVYKNANKQIYFTALYDKFKDELQEKTNITNSYFLHGVIRGLFPNDFSYNKNTICINQSGNTELLSDRIIECIRKTRRPMTKKELQEIFPEMTPIMFSIRIYRSNDIVTWGFDEYYLRDLINISDDEVNVISNIITEIQNQNNGYCSGGMLYKKMKEVLPNVLSKNDIDNGLKAYSLAAAFLSDKFDCSSPHILKKGCFKRISTVGIVEQLLEKPDSFAYDEIIKKVSHFEWPTTTIGNLILKLDDDYLLVADEKYVSKTKLNLENDIDAIESEIKKHEKHGIVTISDSMNYAKLPDIGYEWNGYLLRSVIENFGKKYKVIQVQNKDRRYMQFFVVRKDSEFSSFDQVVAHLMSKNGVITISEGFMLKLLQGAGLRLKRVPAELKTSRHLKYDSEKGTFSVKDLE